MRRISLLFAVGATALLAFAVTVPTTAETRGRASANAAALGTAVRASQVIGMSVHSPEGTEIGAVDDVVFDARGGQVRYAVVSYGGFLGMGDELYAVPWPVFDLHVKASGSTPLLRLNAPEAKLKAAPGFDEGHWPNFADREFTRLIDRHYGVGLRGRDRRPGVDVEVGGRTGVDVGVGGRGGVDVEVGSGGVDVDLNAVPNLLGR